MSAPAGIPLTRSEVAHAGLAPLQATAEVVEALRGELGDLLFETQVHDNSAVTESSGHPLRPGS